MDLEDVSYYQIIPAAQDLGRIEIFRRGEVVFDEKIYFPSENLIGMTGNMIKNNFRIAGNIFKSTGIYIKTQETWKEFWI